jgi:hypothetical protein
MVKDDPLYVILRKGMNVIIMTAGGLFFRSLGDSLRSRKNVEFIPNPLMCIYSEPSDVFDFESDCRMFGVP